MDDDDATGTPLGTEEALAIIADQRAAAARTQPSAPLLFGVWGTAWVLGYGLLWVSVGEDETWAAWAAIVAGAVIVAAMVVTAWHCVTRTHGIRGRSVQQSAMYGWAWFLATVVLWTVGEILTAPQQMAFIADWAPPAARGRYLSLYQASWSLSFALNPVLFLPLHARLGEPLFWGSLVFLAVPATLLLLRVDHADRPEKLRGLTPDPTPTPEILGALTPEG